MRIHALWRSTGNGSQIQSGRSGPSGKVVHRSVPHPHGVACPTSVDGEPAPAARIAGPHVSSLKSRWHQFDLSSLTAFPK